MSGERAPAARDSSAFGGLYHDFVIEASSRNKLKD
jgi:hypothetical protein